MPSQEVSTKTARVLDRESKKIYILSTIEAAVVELVDTLA